MKLIIIIAVLLICYLYKGLILKRTTLFIISAALMLSGCASILPEISPLSTQETSVTQQSIIDDKTTIQELTEKYGQNTGKTQLVSGKNVLYWVKNKSEFGYNAVAVTRLSVLEENGVVKRHAIIRHDHKYRNDFLGNTTQEDISKTIKEGVTTEDSVEAKYGKPYEYSFNDDGNRVMIYVWNNISNDASRMIPIVGELSGTQSGGIHLLLVTLNIDNTVKSWVLNSKTVKRGVGALNASAFEEAKEH